MKKGLISIIIPFYNNERDIKATIESIICQTYDNWEAIFVDDGSCDGSCNIVAQYVGLDNRVKLFRRDREPKGGSTCRNIGVSKSEGEYLVFLDGDDLLASTCLERRWAAINKTEYDFMVFPMAMFTDSTSNCKRLTKWNIRDFDYYYITGAPAWQVTSPIYRRTFWLTINGFDEKFTRNQDIELALRSVIASKGNFKMIENIESDCYYRVPSNGSIVPSYKYFKALESYHYFLDLILKLKSEGNFPNKYKFSLGLLASYCYMLKMIGILRGRREKVEKFSFYNSTDMRRYMLWNHRVILFIAKNIWMPNHLKSRMALVINQYCRWHFMF